MPFSNMPMFDEALKKKYDIAQQEADAKGNLELAQADFYKGRNANELAQAGLHYGPGGAMDRSNLAQQQWTNYRTDQEFGKGGSYDRRNLAEYGPSSPHAITANSVAAHNAALNRGINQQVDYNDLANPSRLDALKSKNRLNVAFDTKMERDIGGLATPSYDPSVDPLLSKEVMNEEARLNPYKRTVPKNRLSMFEGWERSIPGYDTARGLASYF